MSKHEDPELRSGLRKPWKQVGLFSLSMLLPLLFFSLVASNLSSSLAIGMFAVLPLLVLVAGYVESSRELGGTSFEEGELFEQFRAAAEAHGLHADWEHVDDKFIVTIKGLIHDLNIRTESVGTGVAKRLIGADIEIGDPAFDDAALVSGGSLEILSRLNHEQRRRVHSLLSVNPWGPTGSVSAGVLTISASSLSAVLDRPDALEVVALAEGFALDNPLNCKKMERLLAILYEDPNPTVRDKVFVEMMRHRDELELDFDVLVVELIQGHFTRVVSIHGQLQSNQELSQEATKLSDVTEARACIVLNELGPCAVAAAYWLREHGESKESIAALSDVMTDGGRKELTAVASEALAAIRSRLGGSVGGLTVVEEHDAGRLSVVDEQGQLSVGEGELSVADDEQRKKRLAAEARKQRS